MKKTLALIFAIMMIVTCFVSCGNNNSEDNGVLRIPQENLKGVEYGSFNKFKAIDLDGKTFDESIFKGKKLTMINIWATFCRPCIGEMPDLELLNKEYADKDFQVIGIICDVNYSGDGYDPSLYQRALDIVEMTGVTYTNFLPSKSLDKIKLSEVYTVPETIFVDEDGNIVGESYVGSRVYEGWKEVVDNILETMDK